jgi:hypothetical protein
MKSIIIATVGMIMSVTAGMAVEYDLGHVGVFANTSRNFSGAWVHLNSAKLADGTEINSPFQFEVSSPYDRHYRASIGFAELRTGIEFPKEFSKKNNMGRRYFVDESAFSRDFTPWLRSMSFAHASKIRVACNLLADASFVKELTTSMARMNSSDPRYFAFWTSPKAQQILLRQGERCSNAAAKVWPYERVSVALLQTELSRLGYYSGEVDGAKGPMTDSAVASARSLYSIHTQDTELLTHKLRSEVREDEALALVEGFVADNASKPSVKQSGKAPVTSTIQVKLVSEVEELRRQLNASNATVADLQEDAKNGARVPELQRQLDAANQTIADLHEGAAKDTRVQELQRQLDAANATIADLRETTVPASQLAAANAVVADLRAGSVPLREHNETQRSLDAANTTIADLSEKVAVLEPLLATALGNAEQLQEGLAETSRQRDALNATVATMKQTMVDSHEYEQLAAQLRAANTTVADLQEAMKTKFVPLAEHENLRRQIAALNETVTVLQERSEKLKVRWLDAQRTYDAFRDECATEPLCRTTMGLDDL